VRAVVATRRSGRLAVAGGLAVLLARLPVALAHQDTWYPFEVHAGTIACALLDGIELELATLPIVPHVRGSVLFGVLLVPLYALLGISSLTLKLLPVLWHAASVGLLVGLLDRYVARRAALCAGLLFVAAPPMLQKLSTLALASHLESALPWFLCWGAYLAWDRDGVTRGRALRFGAALGFAAFFHLQALLPALLLLGQLALRERRRLLSRTGLWLCAGAAVCAAPAFLFDSGAVTLLLSGVFTQAPAAAAAQAGEGRLAKLAGLCIGDLAAALEFAGPAWPGALALLALGLGALGAVAALRRWPQTAVFPLNALLVAVLYTVSELQVTAEIGAGATNRHLAPLVVALLVCTAVGAARARVGLLPVALCAAVGAMGYASVVRGGESARQRQRGECYEWFLRPLLRAAEGDAHAFALLLERVDRGDARFRSLRFAWDEPEAQAQAEALLAGPPEELAASDAELDEAALLRWTSRGRALAQRIDSLARASGAGALDALAPRAREALLHGVGLALQPPRAVGGLQRVREFVALLGERLAALAPDDARALAEGYGMQLGQVYEPYNRNLGEVLALHADLDPRFGAHFARGLGWGLRQRLLLPPEEFPARPAVRARLDARVVAAFDEAYAGRVLPGEARAFER
jgi:hypothetical protein